MIVAHGSPSAPDGPEAAMRALAARVAKHLPGWQVRGATLAAHGALGAAVGALRATGAPLLVYPHFMADGWFVSDELPRRLRLAGAVGAEVLAPLGLDPALPGLCLHRAREGAEAAGIVPGAATLLIAAHGSPSDARPRAAAERVARAVAATGVFAAVRTGYVDEAPYLADAARIEGPALCLPLFAGRAGHVEQDLPEALAEAGFGGPLLDPIGTDEGIPALIAAALGAHLERRAA
ncbi:cobalamin biosynthesis protein CbiX [Limibaculum sp. FT325]|uniref:CbiX/SirB N-terminal domain-containing protein n=1 Tax=Thermohalobaculum sediminis TaxID=2939436 RepID=UPI0020BF713B|nr:CbiX/SirB N-terminal domain-containing protein [Limibaculum sediminis]MCL5778365.1 cobalamin biosynthesis protein CbiX [Limibaculum sediminis]